MNARLLICSGLLLVLVAGPVEAGGEVSERRIVGDRPLRTLSPLTVPVGMVQNELGYTHADADGATLQTLGEWLFRWGLLRDFEARLLVGSMAWSEAIDGSRERGWSDGGIGLKWTSQHGAGARPTAALLLETSLPIGQAPLGEDTLQPAATIAMAWELGSRTTVGANAGYVWASRDLDRFAEWWGSLALGVRIAGRWRVMVEGYGALQEEPGGDPVGYLDAALTYRLTPRFLVDARYGGGADTRFFGVGLVWRGQGP